MLPPETHSWFTGRVLLESWLMDGLLGCVWIVLGHSADIYDISLIFNNLKTILFADDSTLYITGKNPSNMIHNANSELNVLKKWCLDNRLIINLSKTSHMLLTNKSLNILSPWVYNDNIVKRTDTHTLLGVTIDDNMTFKLHTTNLMLKLSRVMSRLHRVRDICPINIMKTFYDAHVLPHFHYCTPIWCTTYPTYLLSLFRMQKKTN